MKTGIRPVPRLLLTVIALNILLAGVSAQAQDQQVVATEDRLLSVHLPPDWEFRSMGSSEAYSTALVAGENATVLEGALSYYLVGTGAVPGKFAIIAILNPGLWGLISPYPEDALIFFLNNQLKNTFTAWTINDQFQYVLGNSYNAVVYDASSPVLNVRTYIGGYVAENDIVVFALAVNPLRDFDNAHPLLEAIGDSIRVPAEPNALTALNILEAPTQVSIQDLPTRVPSTAAPSEVAPAPDNEIITIPAKENRLSISIPADWLVLDRAADLGTYAYGNTEEAVRSRFGTVYPESLTSSIPLTGLGGLIVLYSMAEYGVDPATPNLQPLMARLLQSLTDSGYEIVEQITPLGSAAANGIYMVARGAEYGYIALVPFGDEIAYISATGMSDTFEPNRDLLMGILRSVRVPAQLAPVNDATPSMGLGGLGGVQTATPTPQATQGGLSGLGGLPGGGVAPTPTP